MMTKFDRLYDCLYDMAEYELVDIWNDICSGDDVVHSMQEFDEYMQDCTPSEIVENCQNINTTDDYFKDGIWGLESSSQLDDLIDMEEVVNYIVRRDEDFGNEDIREILDGDDDEEEEE